MSIVLLMILVPIFALIMINDNAKHRAKYPRRTDWRRTDAVRERDLVDYYMKQGLHLSEAHQAAQRDIEKNISRDDPFGMRPCIPLSAYRNESSCTEWPEDYYADSTTDVTYGCEEYRVNRPKEKILYPPTKEEKAIGSPILDGEIVDPGDFFLHSEFGVCLVKEVNKEGMYEALALFTGEEMTIPVNDIEKIRRLV